MPSELVVSPVFDTIQRWWGEPLDNQLAERIAIAPRAHLDEFLEFANGAVTSLLEHNPGDLRPLFTSWQRNYPSGRGEYQYLERAAHSLLYAHQALAEDPLRRWLRFGDDRADISVCLHKLVQIRPLYEIGALRFVRFPERFAHPSMAHGFTRLRSVDLRSLLDEDLLNELVRLEETTPSEELGQRIFRARSSLGIALRLAQANPGAFNIAAVDSIEAILLPVGIKFASLESSDLREIQLTKLLGLRLPALNMGAVVAVRQSSDDFSEWRANLRTALSDIVGLAPDDEHWQQRALEVIESELSPMRERLERALTQSQALRAARTGIQHVGYSAVGAVAGSAAGGSLTSSLAGAAAGGASRSVIDYLATLKARGRSRALLDVTMTFYGAGR